MSPSDVRLSALYVEAERDWRQVERHAGKAQTGDPARSEADAASVALSLDRAYQVFEQLLVRTERALQLPERAGQQWHRQLLADAAQELPGIRPAVVPKAAERDWEHLLGFRHFLWHAYAVDLDPERLCQNAQRFAALLDALRVPHAGP